MGIVVKKYINVTLNETFYTMRFSEWILDGNDGVRVHPELMAPHKFEERIEWDKNRGKHLIEEELKAGI